MRDEVFHFPTWSRPHLIAIAADRESFSEDGSNQFHLVWKLHCRLQGGAFHFLRKPSTDFGYLKLNCGGAVVVIRFREKHPPERLENFSNDIIRILTRRWLLRPKRRSKGESHGQHGKKYAHKPLYPLPSGSGKRIVLHFQGDGCLYVSVMDGNFTPRLRF